MKEQATKVTTKRPAIVVSQEELSEILRLRADIRNAEARLKEVESTVKTLLEGGAAIEAGDRSAELKTWERATVAWREVVERELGKGYAENVLKHTKPSVYTKLEVL
jgi:hypothetical protein